MSESFPVIRSGSCCAATQASQLPPVPCCNLRDTEVPVEEEQEEQLEPDFDNREPEEEQCNHYDRLKEVRTALADTMDGFDYEALETATNRALEMNVAGKLIELAKKRLDKLKEPDTRAQLIMKTGMPRFVKATWILEQPADFVLERCQELPPEAFVHKDDCIHMYHQDNGLVMVCAPWLTKMHPDPQGYYMSLLKAYLKAYTKFNSHFEEVGVFWDYACMPQPDASGELTVMEQKAVEAARCCVDALWASTHSTVLLMKCLPEQSACTLKDEWTLEAFDTRAWCVMEECMAHFTKPMSMIVELEGKAAAAVRERKKWEQIVAAATTNRKPIMCFEDFSVFIETARVRYPGDMEIIKSIYRRFVTQVAGQQEELALGRTHGPGWGPAEAKIFSKSMHHLQGCRRLYLDDHPLGDEGIAALAESMHLMPALDQLYLHRCQFTEAALHHLKNIVAECSCQNLQWLRLPRALEKTEGGAALKEAWKVAGHKPDRLWWMDKAPK
eukprot:TRINITY_DN29976_c0_g1_i1.p1 TRINITY_DN29976_c0_g1~~TRINITY_DN29976_c0_g1_i1.p1  ORF type:complete len:500 (+),score=117.81 TRINITY_DN29976_c0_g1_i1:66-1565(+)